VLTTQRDRNDARLILIETTKEQLSAIVNAYQALGGDWRGRLSQSAPIVIEPLSPSNEDLPSPPIQ
jgi:outer membrane protein TolC